MAILYKTIKSNLLNSEGNSNFYPKALSYNVIDTDQFVEMMCNNQSVNESEVRAVMAALTEQMMQLLVNGHRVKIDGLGTFSLSVAGTPSLDEKKRIVFDDAHVDKMQFVPDADVKRLLKNVKCKAVDHHIYVPNKLGQDDAAQIARDMLAETPFFITEEFRVKAQVSYSKARTLLRMLVDAGVLECKGNRNGYIYTLPVAK